MRTVIAAMLVVAGGCATIEALRAFDALPEVEREAYDACAPHVQARCCGENTHGCMLTIRKNFVRMESARDRRAYLVQAGCPEVLVASVFSGQPVARSEHGADHGGVVEFRPAGSP